MKKKNKTKSPIRQHPESYNVTNQNEKNKKNYKNTNLNYQFRIKTLICIAKSVGNSTKLGNFPPFDHKRSKYGVLMLLRFITRQN